MKKFLLSGVAALTLGTAGLFAQGQPSPDTQQQAHPDPAPQAHKPETNTGMGTAPQSPDQQQENNGDAAGSSGKKAGRGSKHKNNARQAKGTPKPAHTATGTSTSK